MEHKKWHRVSSQKEKHIGDGVRRGVGAEPRGVVVTAGACANLRKLGRGHTQTRRLNVSVPVRASGLGRARRRGAMVGEASASFHKLQMPAHGPSGA
jgi:hypothetical protein